MSISSKPFLNLVIPAPKTGTDTVLCAYSLLISFQKAKRKLIYSCIVSSALLSSSNRLKAVRINSSSIKTENSQAYIFSFSRLLDSSLQSSLFQDFYRSQSAYPILEYLENIFQSPVHLKTS